MNLPPKALNVLTALKRELLSAPIVVAPSPPEVVEPLVENHEITKSPTHEIELNRSPLLSKQRMRRARTTKATFASRIYQRRRGGF